FPYWDDLRTDGAGGGIFTSVTGIAPNRIFNIEWRACYYGFSCGSVTTDFEARLYEGQDKFELVYGNTTQNGVSATTGVQRGNGTSYTLYSCNVATLQSGLKVTYRPFACGENTFTTTVSPTPTNTFPPTIPPTPPPICNP